MPKPSSLEQMHIIQNLPHIHWQVFDATLAFYQNTFNFKKNKILEKINDITLPLMQFNCVDFAKFQNDFSLIDKKLWSHVFILTSPTAIFALDAQIKALPSVIKDAFFMHLLDSSIWVMGETSRSIVNTLWKVKAIYTSAHKSAYGVPESILDFFKKNPDFKPNVTIIRADSKVFNIEKDEMTPLNTASDQLAQALNLYGIATNFLYPYHLSYASIDSTQREIYIDALNTQAYASEISSSQFAHHWMAQNLSQHTTKHQVYLYTRHANVQAYFSSLAIPCVYL